MHQWPRLARASCWSRHLSAMSQGKFGLGTKQVDLLIWSGTSNLELVATWVLAEVSFWAMTCSHLRSRKACVVRLRLVWWPWFCKWLLLIDIREINWLVRWLCRICIFIRKELCLHFVSVDVGQVVEYVLAKIRAYLLGLLIAAIILRCFIQAIISSECLALSFGVLLEE